MNEVRDYALLTGVSSAGAGGCMLTFLSSAHGLIRLFHRTLKSRRKLEQHDLLQAGELLCRTAVDSAPGRLISFQVEYVFPKLREDFSRLVHGMQFLELTNRMAVEGEPVPQLFTLIMSFLDLLERGGHPPTIRVAFELRILALSGFALCLDSCYVCGVEVGLEETRVSPVGGGVICRGCSASRHETVKVISAGALTVMRKALSLNADRLVRLKTSDVMRKSLRPVIDEAISSVYENLPLSSIFLNRTIERGGTG